MLNKVNEGKIKLIKWLKVHIIQTYIKMNILTFKTKCAYKT